MYRSTPRFAVATALAAAITFPLAAGAGQGVLRGTVADSGGGGVAQVLVTVGGTGRRALTGTDGSFVVNAVPAGRHDVTFVKAGFVHRSVTVQVRDGTPVDLGLITLRRGAGGDLEFTGLVVDEQTDSPVPGAAVTIDGSISGVTDGDGRFVLRGRPTDASRPLPLVAQRIGYRRLEGTLRIPEGQPTIDLRIVLEPQAVELAEIVVEGESRLVPRHMRGFFERRNSGLGTFFTEDEIAAINPSEVPDLLRRVPGLEVIYTGAIGVVDEPVYRFSSSGRRAVGVDEVTGVVDYQGCETALLYIDGVRVSARSFSLLLEDPGRLAGVEAYRGTMTPPQFDGADAEGNTGCGAIVAWTGSGRSEDPRSPVLLNAFYGATLRSTGRSGPRLGANLVFRFIGAVDLVPGFAVLPAVDSPAAADDASGWQFSLNLRGRPLGRESPWYVGGGLSVIKVNHTVVVSADAFGVKAYPMVLTGVEAVVGPARPFAEFQLVDVLHLRRADATVHAGVGIRLGS